MQQQVQEATYSNEKLKEVAQLAVQSGLGSRALTDTELAELTIQWPETVKTAFNRFMAEPVIWDSDPVEDIFNAMVANPNSRSLTARLQENLADSIILDLVVSRGTGPALQGKVVFLVHPTFGSRLRVVEGQGEEAHQLLPSTEWFTIGAILDEGQTVLIFNLRDVAGAPAFFTKLG